MLGWKFNFLQPLVTIRKGLLLGLCWLKETDGEFLAHMTNWKDTILAIPEVTGKL